MLLTIDTLDSQGKPSSSTCGVTAIEESANFLESLLSQRHTLLLAHLWKGNQHTALPLDTFRGSSVESVPMLLQHWQAFLEGSPLSSMHHKHTEIMIDLTRRQINQQLAGIAAQERMISYYNHRIQHVQAITSQQRADFINQENQSALIKHRWQVNKLQGFLERSTKRLHQLLA